MLKLLLFLPSVTFGLIAAEVFPWALLYSILKIKVVKFVALVFIAMLLFSSVWIFYKYSGSLIDESFRSVMAYLNPLLLFFVVLKLKITEVEKLYKVGVFAFQLMIVVGLLQFTSLISFADPILKGLIPRSSAELLGVGRGSTLLSTEPSRAAMEFIFLYAMIRCICSWSAKRTLFYDLLIAIFLVLVLRSAVGLALYLIYLLIAYRLKMLVALTAVLTIAGNFLLYSEVRALQVLNEVISANDLNTLYDFMIDASGFRLVSLVSAYFVPFYSVFGFGVGAWEFSSILAMQEVGFVASEINYFVFHADSVFSGIRPTSYLANIALDLGLVGTIFFIWLIFSNTAGAYSPKLDVSKIAYLFIFCLIFNGAVGNPVSWLCLAISLRMSAREVIAKKPS